MSQQQPFAALEIVRANVVCERRERLEHLPGNGFGPNVLLFHPGVSVGEFIESRVDELAVWLGILQILQSLHAIFVVHPLHLHLGDGTAFNAV